MSAIEIILITLLVWQISAMPLPAWVATAFFGVDQEDYNAKGGWTENKFSFGNGMWAYLVFSLEFIKGILAVSLLGFVHTNEVLIFNAIPFQYILAFVIILGHSFPVFNEFNKSKSTGAYFGVFAGLWLVPSLVALAVFMLIWIIAKRVTINSIFISLGSLVLLTFILFDVKALVIASMLLTTLMVSNYHYKLMAVRA
tara:strand:+ start:69965 stop:70558 length:594 start_codon:yes stop_codon:yes gene_type:complete